MFRLSKKPEQASLKLGRGGALGVLQGEKDEAGSGDKEVVVQRTQVTDEGAGTWR